MRNQLTSIFLALAAILPQLVHAAPSSSQRLPEVLTIRSATDIALERNPTILEAQEKITETGAQTALAKALLYPNLTANLSGNYKKDATNLPMFARFNGNPYNQYLFNFHLSETVYFGISSGLEIPRKDQELSRASLEAAARDLTGKVITAFYKVILDEKLLEALLQTEAVEKESLATAQRRYKIGRGQLLDVLQVKTQLALLSPKIAQARILIENDAAQLANLLGNPQSKEIQLKGDLITLSTQELEAQLKNQPQRFPELEKIEISLERIQAEREVTFGKDLPSISGTLDWSRSAFSKTDLLDRSSANWALGLQLNIPIFSGLSSVRQRQTYASRSSQLELEKENARNTLSLQQIQSKRNLSLSWENIAAASEAFKLAGSSLGEAKKNYQLATIDFLQYLSVQQAYLEAKSSLSQAQFNYISSLVNHFIASGFPLGTLITALEEKS
jgi:outer membrane protein TolC